MYSVFYTIGMVALWGINLLNGTGLGTAYHTTELASIAMLIIAVVCLAVKVIREGGLFVPRRYFYTGLLLAAVFVASSLYNGQKLAGLEGFWVYLIVYVLSLTKPNSTAIRLTGICYGALGLAILYIFNYTELMKGWNDNSIAMIGLFSFLVFMIPFFEMRDRFSKVVLPAVGIIYAFLLWPTDSRSCIFGIALALLAVLRIVPIGKATSSSKGLAVILLVPLFVAVTACLMTLFGDLNQLGQWMADTFNKTLFSGRDGIWMDGFKRLSQTPFFGTGVINAGLWHNSAIACLVAFGIVGYVLWIKLFHVILSEGRPFRWDTCVQGSMVAFLVIFFQQSFELGIFAPDPNLLPYAVLGILLGRINYLGSKR